jgi:hypothetical protein
MNRFLTLGLILAPILSIPPLPAQSSYEEFVKEYENAEKAGEVKLMQRAIKTRVNDAVYWYAELVKNWSISLDGKLRERIDRFAQAFQAEFECTLPEKMERFFSALDDGRRRQLAALESTFNRMYTLKEDAIKSKAPQDVDDALKFALQKAQQLEELGHLLRAAEAYALCSEILNAIPNRSMENRQSAVGYLDKFKTLRDRWDWTKDRTYISNVNFLESERSKLQSSATDPSKGETDGEGGALEGPLAGLGGRCQTSLQSGPETRSTVIAPQEQC